MGERFADNGAHLGRGGIQDSEIFVKYRFASGHVFQMGLNKDETLSARFYRGEQAVFDFSSLLPGWVFADDVYTHLKAGEFHFDRKITPGWKVIPELGIVQIFIFLEGERDILSLLHEIGHARNDDNTFPIKRFLSNQIEDAVEQKNPDVEIVMTEAEAIITSISERNAWAYAVRTFRKIFIDNGIDIREVFPDKASLRNYYDKWLETYSYWYSRITKVDPNFQTTLDKLFDRGKIKT